VRGKIILGIGLVLFVTFGLAKLKTVSAQVPGKCVEQAWQCDGPNGKTTYTACGVNICQACPPNSLAYRTACAGRTGSTKSVYPNCGPGTVALNGKCISDAEAKPIIDKLKNSTPTPSSTASSKDVLNPLQTLFVDDIFNPDWWSQIPDYFVNHIFSPIWYVFRDFHFNNIFNKNWLVIRRCIASVIPGHYPECSDCNKVFESTTMNGKSIGSCTVGNVIGDTCEIINCQK